MKAIRSEKSDDILVLTTMPFFGDALAQTDVRPGPFVIQKAPSALATDMKIAMEFQMPQEAAAYKAALQGMLCKQTLDHLIFDLIKLEDQLPKNSESRQAVNLMLKELRVQMEGLGLNW
jgi:hypothetical protein